MAATQMVWARKPSGFRAGVAAVVPPIIHLRDSTGKFDATATDTITLAITTGTGSLIGTVSKAGVAGIVDFTGLGVGVDTAGDVVLTATGAGLTSLVSDTIRVQPATETVGSAVNPTALPPSDWRISPRYDVYNALNVPAVPWGGAYYDPFTGRKALKLTDATGLGGVAPTDGRNFVHSYSGFGFQVSLPITYGGRTYRTAIFLGGFNYAVDIDEATDEVFNPRLISTTFAADLTFTFSANPATAYILYFTRTDAPTLRRWDVRTNTEAPTAAFPSGGKDFTANVPAVWNRLDHLTSSYDDRYFSMLVKGDDTASDTTGPRALWWDSVADVVKTFASDRVTPFDDPAAADGTTKPFHAVTLDRAGGQVVMLNLLKSTSASYTPPFASNIFWHAGNDSWSRIVEISSHYDFVGETGALFTHDGDTLGQHFYSTLNSMAGSGQIADPHTRVEPPLLTSELCGTSDSHYSGQWRQAGKALAETYVCEARFDHDFISFDTKPVVDSQDPGLAVRNFLNWVLDAGPIYKLSVTYTYPGSKPFSSVRGGIRHVLQYDSPDKVTITHHLVQVASKAAMTEGTFFMDNTSDAGGVLYVWPVGSADASDEQTVRLQPISPTFGWMGMNLWTMDGSDKRFVLHPYSSPAGGFGFRSDYAAQDRGGLQAPDGAVGLFSSNMNVEGGRVDTFFFRMPTTSGGTPTHLALTTEPSASTVSGVAHAVQPAGTVQDAINATVTSDTSTITASWVSETGTGTAGGTLTAVAVAGVWTFTNLSVTSAAGCTGHWHFADGSLTGTDSVTVTITAPATVGVPVTGALPGVVDQWRPQATREGLKVIVSPSPLIGTGGLVAVASNTVSVHIPVGRLRVSVLSLAFDAMVAAVSSGAITVQVFKVTASGTATALTNATSIASDVITVAGNLALPILASAYANSSSARIINGALGDFLRVDIVAAGSITTQPQLRVVAELAVTG